MNAYLSLSPPRIPSVHSHASSGEVHRPAHQLVRQIQQEENQGEERVNEYHEVLAPIKALLLLFFL